MAKCKSCGTEIIWVKTYKGKNTPLDAKKKSFYQIDPDREGVTLLKGHESHWATCPYADKHRRK